MRKLRWISFLLGMSLFCSGCNVSSTAAPNFIDTITYENRTYSWNGLSSELTLDDVLQREGLEKKDVMTYDDDRGTLLIVRNDREKISRYKYADLEGIADSFFISYSFSDEGKLISSNYDFCINADMKQNYCKDFPELEYFPTGKNLEKIQSDINTMLEKLDEKFLPSPDIAGKSESTNLKNTVENPKFWEDAQQANEMAFYSERRPGSNGNVLDVTVQKIPQDDQELIYFINCMIYYPEQIV